jgi:uncharacterized protein YkwD
VTLPPSGAATPTPTPTGPATASPTPTLSLPPWNGTTPVEQQLLLAVGAQRTAATCPPLTLDPRLARAARAHAQDMVARHFFSHTSPGGSTPTSRAQAAGFPGGAAENIGIGYADPAAVLSAWMASTADKANIADCRLTAVGVGYDAGTALPGYGAGSWVMTFGIL